MYSNREEKLGGGIGFVAKTFHDKQSIFEAARTNEAEGCFSSQNKEKKP